TSGRRRGERRIVRSASRRSVKQARYLTSVAHLGQAAKWPETTMSSFPMVLDHRRSVLRQNGEPRGGHICETAAHVEHQRLVAVVGLHPAFPQRGHERRVAEEHAEVALGARRVDLVDLAREQLALRRDQREVQLGGHYASAAMRSALATTSSMPPTSRKALSGRWSYSPSQTALNERMVSSSETKMPGMLLNATATCSGCERNWVMRRARATICLSSSLSSSMPRMAMMSFSDLYCCRISWTRRAVR